jgi:hypothetical protein
MTWPAKIVVALLRAAALTAIILRPSTRFAETTAAVVDCMVANIVAVDDPGFLYPRIAAHCLCYAAGLRGCSRRFTPKGGGAHG